MKNKKVGLPTRKMVGLVLEFAIDEKNGGTGFDNLKKDDYET